MNENRYKLLNAKRKIEEELKGYKNLKHRFNKATGF